MLSSLIGLFLPRWRDPLGKILLPSASLISSWLASVSQDDNEFLKSLRLGALTYYSKLNPVLDDIELQQCLSASIVWEQVTLNDSLKMSVKQLAHGAWLANIQEALIRYPPLKELISRYIFLNPDLSAMQLLMASSYMSMYVLFISSQAVLHEAISLIDHGAQCLIENVIIILETHAQITVQDLQKIAAKGIVLRHLWIFMQSNSQLTLVSHQDAHEDSFIATYVSCFLQNEAMLKVQHTITTTNLSISCFDYYLQQKYAKVEHVSLSALGNNEQAALITKQHHEAACTNSTVEVKTLLLGNSRSFYRGTIRIDEQATATQACQYQFALALDGKPRNCAIPELEIKNNDVQCRHGTAAGQVNEQQLWYLQSRGLSKQQAMKMLVDGFFDSAMLTCNETTARQLVERVKKHIPKFVVGCEGET